MRIIHSKLGEIESIELHSKFCAMDNLYSLITCLYRLQKIINGGLTSSVFHQLGCGTINHSLSAANVLELEHQTPPKRCEVILYSTLRPFTRLKKRRQLRSYAGTRTGLYMASTSTIIANGKWWKRRRTCSSLLFWSGPMWHWLFSHQLAAWHRRKLLPAFLTSLHWFLHDEEGTTWNLEQQFHLRGQPLHNHQKATCQLLLVLGCQAFSVEFL